MSLSRGRSNGRRQSPAVTLQSQMKQKKQKKHKKQKKQEPKHARGQAALVGKTAEGVVAAVKARMAADDTLSERKAIEEEGGGASYSTVKRWMIAVPAKVKPGPDTLLGAALEARLVELVLQHADLGFPISMAQLRAWVSGGSSVGCVGP